MTYGPFDEQRRKKPIVRRVRAGRSRIPVGPGNAPLPRGHAADVARGIVGAAEVQAAAGQVLNLCEKQTWPVRLWDQLVLAAAGRDAELVEVPAGVDLPEDLVLTQPLVVSSARAGELLGYQDNAGRHGSLPTRWPGTRPPKYPKPLISLQLEVVRLLGGREQCRLATFRCRPIEPDRSPDTVNREMVNDVSNVTNQSRYNAAEYASTYSGAGVWTDDGERAAVTSVASAVRGSPILDVGVGAGRTASLLRLLSDDYVAIDYAPEMVRRCRAAHPDLAVEQADARDLSRWADGRFGLVVFSNNGIDSVGHDDRAVVLSEFRRVLRPDGILILSMLNKNGPAFREAPWQMGRYGRPERSLPERAARFAANLVRRPNFYVDAYKFWWRLRGRTEDHGAWGIAPLLGPGTGLLVHYASLPYAVREVRAAGFEIIAAFLDTGQRVDDCTQPTKALYFHLVARRTAAPFDAPPLDG